MDSLLTIKINRVIRRLVITDMTFWSGWGFVNPVFAVFVVQKIVGGTMAVVGISVALYWIIRSSLRIPVGLFLDSHNGEEDDFWFVFFGTILISLVFFGYLMASYPWHIFCLQILFGLGMVIYESGMSAIFTRHIDEGKEATEWGVDSTLAGMGIGIAGGLGGLLINSFGFNLTFILGGILSLLASVILFFSLRTILPNRFHRQSISNFRSLFHQTKK